MMAMMKSEKKALRIDRPAVPLDGDGRRAPGAITMMR